MRVTNNDTINLIARTKEFTGANRRAFWVNDIEFGDVYVIQHYNTVIALIDNNGNMVYFNDSKISVTTTKFQTDIVRATGQSPNGAKRDIWITPGKYTPSQVHNIKYLARG